MNALLGNLLLSETLHLLPLLLFVNWSFLFFRLVAGDDFTIVQGVVVAAGVAGML